MSLISFTSQAQIVKKPSIKRPSIGNKKKSNQASNPTESPAKSDIQMADIYVKGLNKMLENGDFDHNVKRETEVKDKLKMLEERIPRIEKADPNYDTKEYHAAYDKFKAAYDKGVSNYKQQLADQKKRDEEQKIANSPDNKRLREIGEWSHLLAFSDQAITSTQPIESLETFNAGDIITSRAYFKKPIEEVTSSKKYYASFEVDGKVIFNDDVAFPCEGGDMYLDLEIVRQKGRRVNRLRSFNKLANGTHTVKVYLGTSSWVKTSTAIIIGSFELNMTDEGRKQWQEIIDAFDYTEIAQNELPKEGMKNSKVANDAIRFYKDKDFNGTPVKSYIDSDAWGITRTALGSIESRFLDAVVIIKLSDEVCEYSIIGVRQDYNGSGYGSSYYNGIGDTRKVLCTKLK
jgi:hypothetical protein